MIHIHLNLSYADNIGNLTEKLRNLDVELTKDDKFQIWQILNQLNEEVKVKPPKKLQAELYNTDDYPNLESWRELFTSLLLNITNGDLKAGCLFIIEVLQQGWPQEDFSEKLLSFISNKE